MPTSTAADEINPDNFPRVNKAAAILKRELPGIPVFTTSYDDTYGMDGKLGSIDWFCPHNYKYRPEQAAAARKAGKQVWWYICAGPEVYPNNYIESAGIEPRLMMGAMTAKYRPDGFLYYELAFWNSLEPITSGPFVSFKAESYPNYNGDGMWVYPGPDSTPLASIRAGKLPRRSRRLCLCETSGKEARSSGKIRSGSGLVPQGTRRPGNPGKSGREPEKTHPGSQRASGMAVTPCGYDRIRSGRLKSQPEITLSASVIHSFACGGAVY